MIVYRVGKTKFASDLSGDGARLFGGRWNHKLTPCLYCSESRALAILEYTVNIQAEDIPRALSITCIEVADAFIRTIKTEALPGNWQGFPAPASTKDFGTEILKKAEYPFIKIPSVIVPQEYNLLLNPVNLDPAIFGILRIEDFVYDIRIKTNEY
ncbi:MAG: RES domain-containing protein [Chitinophagaceae bacterium]|nr:RES domain-containing protein [Chitinophagaceae bacterium]